MSCWLLACKLTLPTKQRLLKESSRQRPRSAMSWKTLEKSAGLRLNLPHQIAQPIGNTCTVLYQPQPNPLPLAHRLVSSDLLNLQLWVWLELSCHRSRVDQREMVPMTSWSKFRASSRPSRNLRWAWQAQANNSGLALGRSRSFKNTKAQTSVSDSRKYWSSLTTGVLASTNAENA